MCIEIGCTAPLLLEQPVAIPSSRASLPAAAFAIYLCEEPITPALASKSFSSAACGESDHMLWQLRALHSAAWRHLPLCRTRISLLSCSAQQRCTDRRCTIPAAAAAAPPPADTQQKQVAHFPARIDAPNISVISVQFCRNHLTLRSRWTLDCHVLPQGGRKAAASGPPAQQQQKQLINLNSLPGGPPCCHLGAGCKSSLLQTCGASGDLTYDNTWRIR